MTNTSVLHLPIAEISCSLQFRAIDPETIADYVAALAANVELPDVEIAFDEERGTYYMIDGFHRLAAYQYRGAKMITAKVVTMPKREALWLALGANAKNGRRLSNEDKRAAIVLALKERPEASSRVIATHVGCSHQLVLDVKENGCQPLTPAPTPLFDAEIAEESDTEPEPEPDTVSEPTEEREEPERVVGTDGKSYPAKKGKAKPQAERAMSWLGNADKTIQAIEVALYHAFHHLPETITVQVTEGFLELVSTDPGNPLRYMIPLHRTTDWQTFPARAFFTFTKAEWELLEDHNIRTVGDLSELVKGEKTVPKFGERKLAMLEEKFETFWTAHTELCDNT